MSKLNKIFRNPLLWVVLFAVFVRLIYLHRYGFLITSDSVSYLLTAKNLFYQQVYSASIGPPYIPSIRRSPGYPGFLVLTAPLHQWSSIGIGLIHVIGEAINTTLLIFLLRTALSRLHAMAGGIVYAVHPAAIQYNMSLMSECLFTSLCLLSICCLILRSRFGIGVGMIVAGFLLSLATLTRPITSVLPIVLILYYLKSRYYKIKKEKLLLFIFSYAVPIIIWSGYASWLAKSFVFIQSARAVSVYLITLDWPMNNDDESWKRFVAQDPYERIARNAPDPPSQVASDKYAFRLALHNIQDHPGYILYRRLVTFPRLLFSTFPGLTGGSGWFYPAFKDGNYRKLALKILLLVGFTVLPFILSLIGQKSISNEIAALATIVWIYTVIIHIPIWIEYRFWSPVIPFQLISAIVGVDYLLVRIRCSNRFV